MKADWTKRDPHITKELESFGRNGVPLYALYGSDSQQPPVILPQLLTQGIILDSLDEMMDHD
jgi:thiol:disulfide interchange protein DsbD